MATRLNYCRGAYVGYTRGAHWMNKARCPVCGKMVAVRRNGHLRAHGKREVR
jgi:hypothetical protein